MMAKCVTLILIPLTAGSVVNFEDVDRLHAKHADCRLMNLQEWHQGHHYDLRNVTNQFAKQQSESSLLQQLRNITERKEQIQFGRQQTFQVDTLNSTDRLDESHLNSTDRLDRSHLNSTDRLDRSHLNPTDRLDESHQALLNDIIKLTHNQDVLQNTIANDTIREQQLQQKLDRCSDSTSQHHLVETLQSLIYSRSNNRSNEIVRRYFMEHRLFNFVSLTRMWSQFWQQIRHTWSRRWQITEAQEWSGLQRMIQSGEASLSQSEVWRGETQRFTSRVQQWLHLNCSQQIQYLVGRNMLKGQGFFGFLVSQAGEFGLPGPIGSAFSLRQTPPSACFKAESGMQQGRDLYVLTAERLVPRDLSTRVHAAIYGNSFNRDGRQYAFNATSGQFAVTADSNLQRLHNLTGTAEALLSGMSPQTGRYWDQSSQYFSEDRQWWNLYHNEKGQFDEQSSIFTSHQGYYNWRTGKFYRAFGWHDYTAGVYRTSSGWYDPTTRLYHTRIPQNATWRRRRDWAREMSKKRRNWRNIPWRTRNCNRQIKQNAPPAIVIRPPSP